MGYEKDSQRRRSEFDPDEANKSCSTITISKISMSELKEWLPSVIVGQRAVLGFWGTRKSGTRLVSRVGKGSHKIWFR